MTSYRVTKWVAVFVVLSCVIASLAQQRPAAVPKGGGPGGPPPKQEEKVIRLAPVLKDGFNGLGISACCPVELVLTDPLGRRTGYDPRTAVFYEEAPNAGYDNQDTLSLDDEPVDPNPPKSLNVWGGEDGDYKLDIIGTGTGVYHASIDACYNYAGYSKTKLAQLDNMSIAKDIVHTFHIHYENKPGVAATLSGGFNGGGPRPKAVNALMTYANISQTQAKVPGVSGSFPLMIFYSSPIQVATFKADVNGVSISGLFHPEPSGHETVNIPLRSGTNTLSLSVCASISGKEETDHDTLDLIRE